MKVYALVESGYSSWSCLGIFQTKEEALKLKNKKLCEFYEIYEYELGKEDDGIFIETKSTSFCLTDSKRKCLFKAETIEQLKLLIDENKIEKFTSWGEKRYRVKDDLCEIVPCDWEFV